MPEPPPPLAYQIPSASSAAGRWSIAFAVASLAAAVWMNLFDHLFAFQGYPALGNVYWFALCTFPVATLCSVASVGRALYAHRHRRRALLAIGLLLLSIPAALIAYVSFARAIQGFR